LTDSDASLGFRRLTRRVWRFERFHADLDESITAVEYKEKAAVDYGGGDSWWRLRCRRRWSSRRVATHWI